MQDNMATDQSSVTSSLVQENGGVTIELKKPGQEWDKDRPDEKSYVWRQWIAAVGPLAAVTSSGMTAGYSAVLLPQLQEPASCMRVTEEQGSWIASTAVISMALGCVLSGPLMDRVGRRMAHQLASVPFVLGWFVLAGSWALPMLYLGRFITGLCVGVISPVSTVYIAETAGPKARGPLLAAVSFCVSLGVLLVHLLGTYLPWDRVAAASAAFPALCLLCVYWFPDTPSWLNERGRIAQARTAHAWFHGDLAQAPQPTRHSGTARGVFWKPLLVMCLFFTVQQGSGVNALTFYTVQLLRQVGLRMDEYLATLLLDGVRLFFSTAACYLLRLLDRRALALLSGVGTGVSLLGLAMLGNEPAWLPVVFLGAYIGFVSVGLVPLPWIMVGEVFPAASRGLGSGLASCFAFVIFFAVVKTSPAMLAGMGTSWTFATYGLVALLGTGLLLIWLPETRNRTLQEIEDQLKK